MANFIYGKAKQAFLNGQINVGSNSLKILLINSTVYTPAQNQDQFVSDIPLLAIKKRSNTLTNVTSTLGVLDADNLFIPDHDGSAFNSLVIYHNSGSDNSSRLIAYIDTSLGLPFTGSSSSIPITIVWDDGPNKIISL